MTANPPKPGGVELRTKARVTQLEESMRVMPPAGTVPQLWPRGGT